MLKLLIILPCLLIMFQPLNAKVEAPNYNFDFSIFNDFMPDTKVASIEAKYSKGERMKNVRGAQTLKFYVKHPRYNFPVFVQERDGVVLDFFARLPSYFLHDVFHQSIINRYGKQTTYKKVGEEAVYVWEKAPLRHIYSGACTITCFPIFYSVHSMELKGVNPLIQQMKDSN